MFDIERKKARVNSEPCNTGTGLHDGGGKSSIFQIIEQAWVSPLVFSYERCKFRHDNA